MITQYKYHKYLFSIVMAVYDVEEYLEEAIISLEEQTIGFESNVQLILVNDGSPDNSEEICLKYKDKYPNNIVYIKKENGGVSSARNAGMEFVEGKYINFMDADDKMQIDALFKVGFFFERNEREVDVVNIPLFFFEAQKGFHPLYKNVKNDCIVDIEKEFTRIILHTNASFVKAEAMQELRFDEDLKQSEDAKFITTVLLEKNKYGLVCSTKYLYRKRNNGSSAIDNAKKSREWYTDRLDKFFMYCINLSIEKFGEVIPYIQYLIIYDLRWPLQLESLEYADLSENEKEVFKCTVHRILQYIDDKIINSPQPLPLKIWNKLFMLEKKYGADFIKQSFDFSFIADTGFFKVNENILQEFKHVLLGVQFVGIRDNKLLIEGFSEFTLADQCYEICASYGEVYEKAEMFHRKDKDIEIWDEVAFERTGFKFEIDLDKCLNTPVKITIKVDNKFITPNIWMDKFVRLYHWTGNSYFADNGYLVVYKYRSFIVLKNTIKNSIGREYRFFKELKERKNTKIAIIRILLIILKKMKIRPIWMFMDRVDRADDNAEHLFKYSVKKPDKIKRYFVLQKSSLDWDRLSKIGSVVKWGSLKHKILYILADNLISAYSGEGINVLLGGKALYLRNIADFKFIFLQHGITKDDLSKIFGKYNSNISMFVTAANEEYKSILFGNYYYNENIVRLTGFPRYDNLKNNDQNQIFIVPTWDVSLVGPRDSKTLRRKYNPKFKESEYFIKYNTLINDFEILSLAKQNNYKLIFAIHPELTEQLMDFERNDYVDFFKEGMSYQKILNESSLLVTDFSSIAFDFAYMKKPVLYFQWKKNHRPEGYFNYETMGFGKICNEYDALKKEVKTMIKNGCIMEEKYKERVDNFYAFTDRDNCKRVYDEITKI